MLLPLLPDQHHLVVQLDGGDMTDVHDELVHTHAPDDGCPLSANQHRAPVGEETVVAIAVTDGDEGHARGLVGDVRPAVTDAGPGGQRAHAGHAALERQGRAQWNGRFHLVRRTQSIQGDTTAHHIQRYLRQVKRGGAVGHVFEGKGEARRLQLLHHVHVDAELVAGESLVGQVGHSVVGV